MKPLFTIHAGEYLVGSHIEKNYPAKRVWIPSKDTGIDLLVTSDSCKEPVSLQVKFSKDYSETHWPTKYKEEVIASTWFQFTKNEIKKSKAAFWVLVAYPFSKGNVQFLIIEPKTLLERITNIHEDKEIYNLYFTFLRGELKGEKGPVIETRKRKKEKAVLDDVISKRKPIPPNRDFTEFLKWPF